MAAKVDVQQRLKDHDLRVTSIRTKLFQFFMDANSAVSQPELELLFGKEYDRVTIYRTIHSFLDKGILHKIPTDSGSAKYALCHADCSSDHHQDNHVHFRCNVCDRLICLHELQIPPSVIPKAYTVENAVLLYEGKCENCN